MTQQRRRIWWRWFWRIVICLIFGAVVNGVLAGWLALCPRVPDTHVAASDATQVLSIQKYIGKVWLNYQRVGEQRRAKISPTGVETSLNRPLDTAPRWSFIHDQPSALLERDNLQPQWDCSWTEIGVGWPMISFHGVIVYRYARSTGWLLIGSHGLMQLRSNSAGTTYPEYLPFKPVLRGIATNTGVYGLPLLIAWFVAGRWRRFARRGRGLCEYCKYPRQTDSDVCPECGCAYRQ